MTVAADLQDRVSVLKRLTELRSRTGPARDSVTALIHLAEAHAEVAAADTAAGLPDLAETLSRLARACRWAGHYGDDAERARFQGDAARYQLLAAEAHCALIDSGDDQRFDYVYKYVSDNAYDPIKRGMAQGLLDEGVLYVAKFNEDGAGEWLPLVYGENGREGLAKLEEHPDVDLVLMDVMMPELDGHEATRAVREQDRFKKLPIIALTAKAMKGDREKAIDCGASDYVTKPVDSDHLLSVMENWMRGE